MIEFQTVDGRHWRTEDDEFLLQRGTIKAWPNGTMRFRGEDAWKVLTRAIIAWRLIEDPFGEEGDEAYNRQADKLDEQEKKDALPDLDRPH
jgi:hypothetical protein